jgi:LacI family transcriptional regulator
MKFEKKLGQVNPQWEKAAHSIVLDSHSDVALHRQLRSALQTAIEDVFEDNAQFMTENYLVKVLGISRGTVRRALMDLSADSLLERKRAIGTVVRKPEPGTCQHVSVIAPDYASHTNTEFLAALIEVGQSHGVNWNILRLQQSQKMTILERNVRFKPSEGDVILLGQPKELAINLYHSFSKRGYLTVNVDTYIDKYPGHYVGISNRAAVRHGVERLLREGHRRIVFLVTEPEEYDSVRERVRSFEEIIREHGLTECRVFHAGIHAWENDSEAAAMSMPYVWEGVSRPTAIFTVSDGCALGALSWLQMKGIHVPEEVSLLSFDGTITTRCTQPKITSIRQPYQEISEAVFSILKDRPKTMRQIFVEPSFSEGGSVRKLTSV